jgi:putative MFS transporter
MGVLAIALIIDIMKPASLGFVTPGMRMEYGVDPATVALLALSALLGTAAGSFVWGGARRPVRQARFDLAVVGDVRRYLDLRRHAFLRVEYCNVLSDGAAARGMLPVAYALLAEIMPTRRRGWCLVLIGGIGTVGGYLAASALSALLQPFFGWRVMWFLNLPTGLILIGLSPLLPESARFLQHMGRFAEAQATMARFAAQAFGVAGLVPALGVAGALVAIPAVFSLVLILLFGRETRGRDLRDLESSPARGAAVRTEAVRAD